MSQKNKEYRAMLIAGVYKIDFTAGGYKDLLEIAQEWSKDPNFHEIIIRAVSETNWGIQFVYISPDASAEGFEKHKKLIKERFSEGLYAKDVSYSSCTSDDTEGFGALKKRIIVLKTYEAQE